MFPLKHSVFFWSVERANLGEKKKMVNLRAKTQTSGNAHNCLIPWIGLKLDKNGCKTGKMPKQRTNGSISHGHGGWANLVDIWTFMTRERATLQGQMLCLPGTKVVLQRTCSWCKLHVKRSRGQVTAGHWECSWAGSCLMDGDRRKGRNCRETLWDTGALRAGQTANCVRDGTRERVVPDPKILQQCQPTSSSPTERRVRERPSTSYHLPQQRYTIHAEFSYWVMMIQTNSINKQIFLPALLQKLVGDLFVSFWFFAGKSGGNLAGSFWTHKMKAQQKKIGEHFGAFFVRTVVTQKNLSCQLRRDILRDLFGPTKRRLKNREKCRSIFRENICHLKKIIRANFVLQTCHPKNLVAVILRNQCENTTYQESITG